MLNDAKRPVEFLSLIQMVPDFGAKAGKHFEVLSNLVDFKYFPTTIATLVTLSLASTLV